MIYYDPAQKRSKAAATALQNADAAGRRRAAAARRPSCCALDPGSMLLVVLGTDVPRHDRAAADARARRSTSRPYVRFDAQPGTTCCSRSRSKVKFPLMVPTVLERNSYPDTLPGDKPVRRYWIDEQQHKAVRLVFRTGGERVLGRSQETDWDDAPALADKSFRHDLGGREFDLYYSGSHLHMVVLRAHGATATGSSTRCSTRSRTRRCSRSPRASNR